MSGSAQIRHNQLKSKLLTSIAHGVTQAEHIGTKVFPIVQETQKNLEVPIFGTDAFTSVSTKRAPGAPPAQGTSQQVTTIPVQLIEYAYEEFIDRQETEDGDLFNLKKAKSKNALQKVLNGREINIANKVNDYASYGSGNKETLTTTDQWTHEDSNPFEQIMDGKTTIEKKLGVTVNTLTLGAESWNALFKNVKLRKEIIDARIGLVTIETIKQILEIDNLFVGKAIDTVAGVNSFVWKDNAVLSYTTTNKNPNKFDPSFGFTFQRKGHPYITESQDRNGNIDFFTAYLQYAAEVISYDAAYIFKDTNG